MGKDLFDLQETCCAEIEDSKTREDNIPRDLFGNPIGKTAAKETPAEDDIPRDLFGNPIGRSSTNTSSNKNKASKTTAGNKEEKPIGKPMIVRLYGHNIPVTDVNMTLEDIRKMLSKDFPELSKDRTEMVLDEKAGLIIPVIKAARKGNLNLRGQITYNELIDVISLGKGNIKPVNDMTVNGYPFEVRKNEIGVFVAPLSNAGGSFFVPLLPPIPLEILTPIIRLFYENAARGLEAAGQIFWDRENKQYFSHIPQQAAQSCYVDIQRSTHLELEHLLVMDIHSHHAMPPKFSSMDDTDEVETRLYAVVGNIPKSPGISVRASCSGKFIPLNPKKIFRWKKTFPFEVFTL